MLMDVLRNAVITTPLAQMCFLCLQEVTFSCCFIVLNTFYVKRCFVMGFDTTIFILISDTES